MHALVVHRPGAAPERRVLGGPLRAGGSNADELRLPGTPPAALRLLPSRAGVVVEAMVSGVRVGGRPVAAGARRLLRPGERAELREVALLLDRDDPGAEGTRAAAAALLRDAVQGAAPIAGPHLVVLTGRAAGARYSLAADQTLGRGRGATIRIADPHASRIHARVRVGPHGATIEDLSSKNGVRVNGVRIEPRPCGLRPGDEIGLGETSFALDGLTGGDGGTPASGSAPAGPPPRLCPPPRLVAAGLLALSAAALALAAR